MIYREGIRILEQAGDRPILIFLKTIDLHQPGPFVGQVPLPDWLRQQPLITLRAVWAADYRLREMFERLEAQGQLDDKTLYVITADHSPHPGLGGDYAKIVPPERQRRLERVPLIFVSRNLEPLHGLDPELYASQIDLAPTILSLLGIASPASFIGRNILAASHPGYAIGHYNHELFLDSAERSLQFSLDESPAFLKWIENSRVERKPR